VASFIPAPTRVDGSTLQESGGAISVKPGGILDTHVGAAAAVAVSKLAKGAASQVLVTDSGATTAQWAKAVNANIDAAAAIDGSKVNLGGALFTTMTDVVGSRAYDTVYQAGSVPRAVAIQVNASTLGAIAQVGSANPPTVELLRAAAGTGDWFFLVPAGWYYRVSRNGGAGGSFDTWAESA